MTEYTTSHKVVVIGGGYAGTLAANRLRRRDNVDVTLVNPRPEFVERIRLHQFVARTGDATIDYGTLLGEDIQLVVDSATRIDTRSRTVQLASGRALDYDHVIYAVGSTAATPSYRPDVLYDRSLVDRMIKTFQAVVAIPQQIDLHLLAQDLLQILVVEAVPLQVHLPGLGIPARDVVCGLQRRLARIAGGRAVGVLAGLRHHVARLGRGDDQSKILSVVAGDRRASGAQIIGQVAEGARHAHPPGLILPVGTPWQLRDDPVVEVPPAWPIADKLGRAGSSIRDRSEVAQRSHACRRSWLNNATCAVLFIHTLSGAICSWLTLLVQEIVQGAEVP
ncbi:FAD-dependent oxidoreductase [Nonomuraea sp. JJY05]|uniref:FAD-dependent oxidoreductase n=1 Tax=Nonomuraea sp. JJY05 TaxID=3350255 RepID=UPI00373EA920